MESSIKQKFDIALAGIEDKDPADDQFPSKFPFHGDSVEEFDEKYF